MTTSDISDKIPLVADRVIDMERYRSGHNEAVLKTVCPQGRVGSNPTLSAREFFFRNEIGLFTINRLIKLWRNTQEAEGAPLERE